MEVWEIALGVVALLVTTAATAAGATAWTYSLVSSKVAKAHERIDAILKAYDDGDDTLHDRANQLSERISDLKASVFRAISKVIQRVIKLEVKIHNGMGDEIKKLRDARHEHANHITGLHGEILGLRTEYNGLRAELEKIRNDLK